MENDADDPHSPAELRLAEAMSLEFLVASVTAIVLHVKSQVTSYRFRSSNGLCCSAISKEVCRLLILQRCKSGQAKKSAFQ